jgi:hypothetical protein
MNNPFVWFLGTVIAIGIVLMIMLRDVLRQISKQATAHAASNAHTYVRGMVFVFGAFLMACIEKFQSISVDQADFFRWWNWSSLFMYPILQATIALGAWLDKSFEPPTYRPPAPPKQPTS